MTEYAATMRTSSTLTLHECCEALRANRVSISEEYLGQALEDGKLPFGFVVRGKQRVVIIFRHAFYAWLKDQLGEDVCEI